MQLTFATFDIETSGLRADFEVTLCACIKPFGRDPIAFRADKMNPEWLTKRGDDRALVMAVRNELTEHAVIVTHYGIQFDLRFLKARLFHYNLPALPPLFMVDTLSLARANLAVSSRRLANLGVFGLDQRKSKVEGPTWVDAALDGDVAAMDEIVAHNIQDCVMLEELAQRLFPYAKSIRRY